MSASTDLTPRERATLRAVARRFTNAEIADELCISVRTVESHVSALRRKLGAECRADLVAAFGERTLGEEPTHVAQVLDATRTWAFDPVAHDLLLTLMRHVGDSAGLDVRDRLLVGLASSSGDERRTAAGTGHLPGELSPATSAAVLAGDDDLPGLSAREAALVRWVRVVTTAGPSAPAREVAAVREAGWTEAELFAVTVLASLWTAFPRVDGALAARATPAPLQRAPSSVPRWKR